MGGVVIDNKCLRRLAMFVGYISMISMPILVVLILISLHSNTLITQDIAMGLFIVLPLLVLLIIGCSLFVSTYKVNLFKNKIVLCFVAFSCLASAVLSIALYGPYNEFRNWLITTAMSTMNHQHYCKWFYSDEEIEKVLSGNYVEEVAEETDETLIESSVDREEQAEIVDKYVEENIQDHVEDSVTLTEGVVVDTSAYKLIRLRVNGQIAYLACVYDPSKVVLAYTDKLGVAGRYVTKMAEQKNALLGINGGGFYDPGANSSGGTPGGLTIAGGEVVTNNTFRGYSGGGLIGFNKDNKLCLMKDATAETALAAGIRDAVSWGPFLVVNGKSSYVSGNGGWGMAARTAIGQTSDGTVLLLVVNSNSTRSKGASMRDLADIMISYGAVNAANLDGGTSSVMVMPSADALAVNPRAKTDGYSTAYRIINDPVDSSLRHKTRPIADAWVVLK